MARSKAKDEANGEATRLHNQGARADIIRSACKEIVALEKERAGISADIGEIKQKKIKGDLGMKLSDFAVALRFYRLEQEDEGGGRPRDEFLDTLRECFEALGQGEQLDWLKQYEERPAASM